MKVAIALLNFNGKKHMETFLPGVIKYSEGAEVYVIDNGSTDDSMAWLEKSHREVKIIRNAKNFGFAKGYNEGLKHVDAEVYVLLNSDVEVTENWISEIIRLFLSVQDVAVIQPKILDYHKREYFEYAGGAGGFLDNLGYPYCRGRIFDSVEKDTGQYDDAAEIFWASGCAFFVRSKVFWEHNGFDERYFAHQEEIDLCWRIINSGKKIYYTHRSSVYHIGGGTLQKSNPKKTYLNIRNNLTTLLKNLPLGAVFYVLPLRLILDGCTGIFLGLKYGPTHFLAVIRGHFGFYTLLPETLKKRAAKQTKNYYQKKWLILKFLLGKLV
ncbi:MAG: glycosyltransferase family 2 protein [Bergeyella sp.]|nr:glycosyltransferase family 2 protein [Bergeyella sp.]